MKYKLARYFSDGRRPQTIKRNATLNIAYAHFSVCLSKGKLKNGVEWFDGYVADMDEGESTP